MGRLLTIVGRSLTTASSRYVQHENLRCPVVQQHPPRRSAHCLGSPEVRPPPKVTIQKVGRPDVLGSLMLQSSQQQGLGVQ
jgi:hypothetical protein